MPQGPSRQHSSLAPVLGPRKMPAPYYKPASKNANSSQHCRGQSGKTCKRQHHPACQNSCGSATDMDVGKLPACFVEARPAPGSPRPKACSMTSETSRDRPTCAGATQTRTRSTTRMVLFSKSSGVALVGWKSSKKRAFPKLILAFKYSVPRCVCFRHEHHLSRSS